MKGDGRVRHFILTGHSHISEGIASAIEFVLGISVSYFNAYVEGEEFYLDKILAEIEKYPKEDEIIIMTDILGGSVNNDMMKLTQMPNVHLICGTNLALAAQIVMAGDEQDIGQIIRQSIQTARDGIQYCNEVAVSDGLDGLDDF